MIVRSLERVDFFFGVGLIPARLFDLGGDELAGLLKLGGHILIVLIVGLASFCLDRLHT